MTLIFEHKRVDCWPNDQIQKHAIRAIPKIFSIDCVDSLKTDNRSANANRRPENSVDFLEMLRLKMIE